MLLKDKVCVVTGASSGIGRATAVRLRAEGATVCAAARREERLQDLMDQLGGTPHSYVVADVTDQDQVRRLGTHIADVYARCDVLINNAGIPGRRLALRDPGAVGDLERVIATNFFGAVYCTAALLPLLQRSAPSSVVNIASVAGRIAVGGAPAYTASKFALVGWSEALHYELAPSGIRVTLVEPGFVSTEAFPQSDLVANPVLRRILATDDQVAGTIIDAIAAHSFQRTVPRWYYFLQVPRVITPALFRAGVRTVMRRYGRAPRYQSETDQAKASSSSVPLP